MSACFFSRDCQDSRHQKANVFSFQIFLRCFEIKSECYSTVSSVHRHAIHRSTRKRLERSRSCWTADQPLGDPKRSHKKPATTWLRRRKLHLVHTRLGGFTGRLHCLWVHWSIMTWEVSHCISTFAISAFPWIVINGDIAKKHSSKVRKQGLFRWNERSHRFLVFSVKLHSAKLTIMLNPLDVYDTSLQDSRAGDGKYLHIWGLRLAETQRLHWLHFFCPCEFLIIPSQGFKDQLLKHNL